MKSGDLIQIQKTFRVQQCGQQSINRLHDYELFPALTLQPGEVYLLTDFYRACEAYPIYNYFEITILAGGTKWETTISIDDENEISSFIKLFESPTLC